MFKIELDNELGGTLVFNNSQDDVVINIPKQYVNVGIKISGGADSALVAYMLASYVMKYRRDIVIIPITLNAEGKHYQQIFASKVLAKISELTGVVFGTHYYKTISAATSELYVTGQENFVYDLYKNKIIQGHFVGITANPSESDAPHLFGPNKGLPSDDRKKLAEKRPQFDGGSWRPLINTDKKGVAEHYARLNLMESLFPLTRSCEAFTEDFSHHCGKCWFCQERLWGFGKLE